MYNFPSFEDFEATLTMEQIEKWVTPVNDTKIQFTLPLTEFNIKNFYTALATSNVLIAKQMLSAYHEWLAEQLEKNSLRLVSK